MSVRQFLLVHTDNTREGIVLIRFTCTLNFVRILIFINSRSSLKAGHFRSKTRWLGEITEKNNKLCVHSRGQVLIQTA